MEKSLKQFPPFPPRKEDMPPIVSRLSEADTLNARKRPSLERIQTDVKMFTMTQTRNIIDDSFDCEMSLDTTSLHSTAVNYSSNFMKTDDFYSPPTQFQSPAFKKRKAHQDDNHRDIDREMEFTRSSSTETLFNQSSSACDIQAPKIQHAELPLSHQTQVHQPLFRERHQTQVHQPLFRERNSSLQSHPSQSSGSSFEDDRMPSANIDGLKTLLRNAGLSPILEPSEWLNTSTKKKPITPPVKLNSLLSKAGL